MAVGLGALAVLAWVVLVWSMQRRVVFPAPPAPELDAAAGIAGVIKTRVGPDQVEAWLLEPPASETPSPAIIFAHGNGELIDHWIRELQVMREWGIGVLLVEYPGYGRSPGSPSERTVEQVFVAGYDYLASRPDVDAARIVGYGRSLGGGAICRLAAKKPLAALILESTFSSIPAVARSMGVPRALVRDRFDNLAVLREYEGPVLLLHGRRDRIIPFSHAETLREYAPNSRFEAVDCGHNDCPRPWSRIREFLDRAGLV